MNKEMEAAVVEYQSRIVRPLTEIEKAFIRYGVLFGHNAHASRLAEAEAVIEALGQCEYCRGTGKDWTRDFITMERKVIDCDGCKGTGVHPEAYEYRRKYPAETAKGEENG